MSGRASLSAGDDRDAAARRRRILVTTVILAVVAIGFYASIFLAVSARHH